MLYIKIGQHLIRNTLGNSPRRLVFSNLKNFIFLKDSYIIYKNWSTFHIKHFDPYIKRICVLQFENFHLLVTLSNFFFNLSPFRIQMTNVVYKNFSTFLKKHVAQYSEVIGLFKFENFLLLVKLISFFLPFSPFTI